MAHDHLHACSHGHAHIHALLHPMAFPVLDDAAQAQVEVGGTVERLEKGLLVLGFLGEGVHIEDGVVIVGPDQRAVGVGEGERKLVVIDARVLTVALQGEIQVTTVDKYTDT